ncbi:hypothetical protein EMIT0196P_40130 [Pseudomonas chlororaphis]
MKPGANWGSSKPPTSAPLPVAAVAGCDKAEGLQRSQGFAPPSAAIAAFGSGYRFSTGIDISLETLGPNMKKAPETALFSWNPAAY